MKKWWREYTDRTLGTDGDFRFASAAWEEQRMSLKCVAAAAPDASSK